MKKPIDIVVFHTVSVTDYEPHEEWRMEGSTSAKITKTAAMREAESVVGKLRTAGIPAQVVVRTRRQAYPKGF